MSYREDIANAAKAVLLGKTDAGDKIMTSLDRKLDPEKDLPAVMVYCGPARRGPEDYGQSLIPRQVTLIIECATRAPAMQELQAAAQFAEQIEAAMDADRSLGNVVNDSRWQQTMPDVTSHGAVTMGVAIIQYEVEILTNQRPDWHFEFNDDGFTAPPSTVQTVPGIVPPADDIPPPPPDTACGPNGCNIPDWAGEL